MAAVEMTNIKSADTRTSVAPTAVTKGAPKKSWWGKIIPDTFYASK